MKIIYEYLEYINRQYADDIYCLNKVVIFRICYQIKYKILELIQVLQTCIENNLHILIQNVMRNFALIKI